MYQSTKGTMQPVTKDFEHMDMDEFDENWTVTDGILEKIRCEEERQDEAEEKHHTKHGVE